MINQVGHQNHFGGCHVACHYHWLIEGIRGCGCGRMICIRGRLNHREWRVHVVKRALFYFGHCGMGGALEIAQEPGMVMITISSPTLSSIFKRPNCLQHMASPVELRFCFLALKLSIFIWIVPKNPWECENVSSSMTFDCVLWLYYSVCNRVLCDLLS